MLLIEDVSGNSASVNLLNTIVHDDQDRLGFGELLMQTETALAVAADHDGCDIGADEFVP